MRSRKDFSKEFELVVQQEIKNYNDTVLATNQSLERSKQAIEDLSNKTDKSFAKQDSKFILFGTELEYLKHCSDNVAVELGKRIDVLSKQLDEHQKNTFSLIGGLEDRHVIREEFYRILREVRIDIEDLISDNNRLKDVLSQEISRSVNECSNKLDALKKEILKVPSEAESVRKELEKKLDVVAVDSTGIIREIEICKKSQFIIEKKIENIYTLIERLEKRFSL